MSFSWKGLLGVGGTSGSAASGSTVTGDAINGLSAYDEKDIQWDVDDVLDVPNMLGMQNFGYTCYVNSVVQALYYCKPFRESLLTYSALVEASSDSKRAANGKKIDLKADNKVTSTLGVTDHQHLDEVTFFTALRRLFSNMVTATVTPAPPEVVNIPASTTSYLASGLSRKNTSKSGAANLKTSGNLSSSASMPSSLMLAPSLSLIPPSSTTSTKRIVNSCSHIIVQDEDIKNFISTLKRSNILFDSTAHQDAHELLNFILNRIGEDVVEEAKEDGRGVKSSKVDFEGATVSVMDVDEIGRTWVHRVFEGILTNETRCLTCETVTSRDESFLDLSIDIERNSSVTACLRQFSASEMLCARNKFFCDTCSSLQEAEKRMKVKKLPNVLALHLKRFKYEEALQRFVKLAYRVVFPFEMRLFNTSDDAKEPDKLYELFAIIVHLGMGPHQGHYISIVRVGIRWFVFDDETITIIDEADISRYFGDTPGAGSAYVLFYQAVELNMAQLGLVDTAVERQKVKERKEQEALAQYEREHSTAEDHVTSAVKDIPPRLFTTSPAPMQGSISPSESAMPPSTPQTRKHNTISSLSSQNSHELAESKGTSWFSSLRPGSGRKPSSNNFLSVVGQQHSGNAGHGLPIPFKSSSGHAEDADAASSISTSSSSRHAPKDVLNVSASIAETSLISRSAFSASPGEMINSDSTKFITSSKMIKQTSQGTGAAYAPAARPLSKKEQESIAKKSRRSSVTVMSANSTTPLPFTDGNPTSPIKSPGQSLIDAASTAIPESPISDGRQPLIRRPSIADAPVSMPRRKTISRTFGFSLGRKTGKS